MKCKFCDGSGKDYWCHNGEPYPCPVCDGTGEYEPFDADVELDKLYPTEQTNEEYIKSLNTEQLAEFINDVSKKCYTCGDGYTPHPAYCPFHKCLRGSVYGITEWLKQPHKPIS